MAGLALAIHAFADFAKTWMPGTGPGMTCPRLGINRLPPRQADQQGMHLQIEAGRRESASMSEQSTRALWLS
jgi:hypothetical protein